MVGQYHGMVAVRYSCLSGQLLWTVSVSDRVGACPVRGGPDTRGPGAPAQDVSGGGLSALGMTPTYDGPALRVSSQRRGVPHSLSAVPVEVLGIYKYIDVSVETKTGCPVDREKNDESMTRDNFKPIKGSPTEGPNVVWW